LTNTFVEIGDDVLRPVPVISIVAELTLLVLGLTSIGNVIDTKLSERVIVAPSPVVIADLLKYEYNPTYFEEFGYV